MAHTEARKSFPLAIVEEMGGVMLRLPFATRSFEILLQRGRGGLSQRDQTFTVPFAAYTHETFIEVEIIDTQSGYFRNSHPASIKHGQDCPITDSVLLVHCGGAEQLANLCD